MIHMKTISKVLEGLESKLLSDTEFLGFELANDEYNGFTVDHTGMSYYDNFFSDPEYMYNEKYLIGKVVAMSPKSYLDIMTDVIFHKSEYDSWKYIYDSQSELDHINDLADKIRSGVKLDTPMLDDYNGVQEGRHRAVAALELGIDEIPVLYVTDIPSEEKREILTKWYSKSNPRSEEVADLVDLDMAKHTTVGESFTSEFINGVSKLKDRSILVEIKELMESLEVSDVSEIDSALESIDKIKLNIKDPIGTTGWYNKLNNKWKKLKSSIKELLK